MTKNSQSSFWSNILLTALAPAIWGSTYIVTSQLLPAGRPFTAALIRVLPAGIMLVMFMRHLPARREWGRLLILSALNIGLFQALLFIAAYRLPGGLAAVVGAIQPLLVMLLAWTVDRHPPVALALWSSVMGIVGMAILLLSPNTVWEPIGIAAAIGGAASMAAGTYLTRRWRPTMPILALTGWQLLLGGVMLVPFAWVMDAPLTSVSLIQTLAYLYLCLAGALLAYALWFRGLVRLPAVAVSSLGLLSPLTAVILGWLLLEQAITGISLLGLLMVLISVLAVQWATQRRPRTL